jgi:hypothetical protein
MIINDEPPLIKSSEIVVIPIQVIESLYNRIKKLEEILIKKVSKIEENTRPKRSYYSDNGWDA